jgi:hypothetical protein
MIESKNEGTLVSKVWEEFRLKKINPDLNLFPLVIDVLKPGQEEAAVVARPDVSVLLLLQKK